MICPLCGREMPPGSSSRHHLVPKSRGGHSTTALHKICHSKIHSLFTNKELETTYNTAEALLAHPDIVRFVVWIQRRPADYQDKSDRHAGKRRKVG